jgi:hypothetical protein
MTLLRRECEGHQRMPVVGIRIGLERHFGADHAPPPNSTQQPPDASSHAEADLLSA